MIDQTWISTPAKGLKFSWGENFEDKCTQRKIKIKTWFKLSLGCEKIEADVNLNLFVSDKRWS